MSYTVLKNDIKFMVFKKLFEENLFQNLSNILSLNNIDQSENIYDYINKLINIAESYALEGSLWQRFCTLILVYNENPYTTAVENTGSVEGTLKILAMKDINIFYDIYNYSFKKLSDNLNIEELALLDYYICSHKNNDIFSPEISEQINILSQNLAESKSPEEFLNTLNKFYATYGVGKIGLHKAFRISDNDIIPVIKTENITFDDLIGYELQKQTLIENTKNFINGKQANNVLLFGDSGTGKSSSIKATLNKYYKSGLRMIEIYKHQFINLSSIISQIRNRNYKFIIYMDDLSFEDYETEYKYLKAVIEGGLETRPQNIIIYATSNRRHLIREQWSDRDDRDNDLHRSDTMQEKLSLASRFGVTIFYGSPNKKEYQNIVKVLAEKHDIHIDKDELYTLANKWEIRNGGFSGRTAQQFITYLVGKYKQQSI